MPSSHALLSASSAHRWLACTPSARLEETLPEQRSIYAIEGTQAHALAEYKLRKHIFGETERPKFLDTFIPDEEMERCTDEYVDFVEEEFNAAKAKTPDAKLFVEYKLDFAEYVPEGFGTTDVAIVADEQLEVIDFKYGKGVAVDAKNNPQTRLYGLGAYTSLNMIYDFSKVKTTIFQPRLNSISSEELTVDELLLWAEEIVKPRAEIAFKGEGDYNPGEHCRFCRAAAVCRARAEIAFAVVEEEHKAPPLLTDDEVSRVLDKLDTTEDWINAIREYAKNKAISGHKWTGYKLVESRTLRKIQDPITALSRLEGAGYSADDVTTVKLKGLTELEKYLTKSKFNQLLGDLVVKPQGQPTLVKITDKRPEINPIEQAFK